jgi:hypothetical protein
MVQKVNFNNLTGDTLTVGNTTINGTGVTVGGAPLSGGSGGATQYANTASLPKTDLTFGEFALVGNTLFITNGVGWYSVALINQSPSLSISVSDISLGATGNTINFTYTATDPDGPEPTVTLETTANTSQANVTLYTSNSTVTVENLSAEDYSANITLTATDDIDQTFGTVTLNVIYLSEYWNETALSIGTSSTDGLNNSTFIDRSTNAHTVTPSGSPVQTAFHPYLENWSVEFDGTSSSYVGLSSYSSTPLYNNNGDLTIECWVYSRTTSVVGIFDGSPLVYDGIRNFPANTIEIVKAGGGPSCSFSIPTFKWVHFATVIDNSNISVYVDGVLADTTTYSDYALANDFDIGVVNEGGAGKFDGYISNFRITTEKLYTSNFTPLTTELTQLSNTTFLGLKNNRFISSDTVYGGTLTPSGTPKISAFNPFGQESEYVVGENKGSTELDGSGDYLSVADDGSNDLDFGTGDFTIETWIYATSSLTSSNLTIIDARPASGSTTGNYYFLISSTGKLRLIHALGASDTIYESTSTLSPNQWYHVVASRSGDNLRLFIDGVVENTTSVSGKSFNATLFNIGYKSYTTSSLAYWPGYLSDLRIVKGTSLYTTNFTPPTAPVGNTNASLYLPMDNAGIFDKTGNHTVDDIRNVSTSTSQTKFADTSLHYSASDSYMVISEGDIADLGKADWTVEGWVYATSYSNSDILVGASLVGTVDTSQAGWSVNIGNDINSTRVISNASGTWQDDLTVGTGLGVPLNQWCHFAVAKDGDNLRIFIDGSVAASRTGVSSWDYGLGATGQILVGAFNDGNDIRYHQGYLENVQILKGVAKYTANFTVPDRTQGRLYQAES